MQFCYFRLEIGVQSVHEDVARDTNRGHTVKAVCENFNLAKDAGFKVTILVPICKYVMDVCKYYA